MKRFSWLLALTVAPAAFAQAPVISPLVPSVNGGTTQQFTCPSSCGSGGAWSVSGVGSIDPVTGVYTAPAVTAKQSLAGYQLLPNNHIFNTRIDQATSGLPGTAVGGGAATCCFNLLPSFPINYVTSSCATDSMVFFYTPGNNGTYCAPSSNNGLSGLIESGWYQARHTVPGVSGVDHHYLKVNSQTGQYEEQYQYYLVGNGTPGEGCALCNSQSGVKYNSTDYISRGDSGKTVDAGGLYLLPLMLRRQEFDTACAAGAGTGSINHALRVTLNPGGITNNGFIWPGMTGASGSGSNPEGTRFRLKSTYNPSVSACAGLIITLLKNYGLILADAGFSWQHNAEYGPWSEADVGYFAAINALNIPASQFEVVDESSLIISSSSWEAGTGRETVTYTSSSGATSTDIVLVGVTVGMTQDAVDIMAGSPTYQLNAVVKGTSNTGLAWSISPSIGSISSGGQYMPPATLATESTITVTATSAADSTVSATTILRVWPNGSAYVLPSFAAGNDFTDTFGHVWRSGGGTGIPDQQGQLGCCADYSAQYTGSATNNKLWNHAFTGSTTNLVDNQIYWIVPAGTYNLTFHSIARDAPAANTSNVNFISQGSLLASNVDFAGSGVGQYGPYNRTDAITVGCSNQLTYDEQTANINGFEAISSFSIIQTSSTQSSCTTAMNGVVGTNGVNMTQGVSLE